MFVGTGLKPALTSNWIHPPLAGLSLPSFEEVEADFLSQGCLMTKTLYLPWLKVIQILVSLLSFYGFCILTFYHLTDLSRWDFSHYDFLQYFYYWLITPFSLALSIQLLRPIPIIRKMALLLIGLSFILELLLVTIVSFGLLEGVFDFTAFIRSSILVILGIYFFLPRVKRYFTPSIVLDSRSEKHSHHQDLRKLLSVTYKRVQIAFPLTLKGHFVVIASGLAGYFIAYKQIDLLALIFSLGGISILSLLLTLNILGFLISHLLLKRKPEMCQLDLPFHEGTIGVKLPYTLSLKGWTIVPLFKMSFNGIPSHISPLYDEIKKSTITCDLFSRGDHTHQDTLTFLRRGDYHFDKLTLSNKDALGLTHIQWEIPLDEEILILPRVHKKEYDFYHLSSTKENYIDSTHRLLDGDYYEHRPYAPGDDVRRINWKLTAKRRELFIRIPEKIQPAHEEVLVFLSTFNPYIQYYESDEMLSLLDTMVEELISYCYFLTQKGFKVLLSSDCAEDSYPIQSQWDSILRHLTRVHWQKSQPIADSLEYYIISLKKRSIEASHIAFFVASLSDDWVHPILDTLMAHQTRSTLFLGQLSPLSRGKDQKANNKLPNDWLTKLLLIDPVKGQRDDLFKWDWLSKAFSNQRLPKTLVRKIVDDGAQTTIALKEMANNTMTSDIVKVHTIGNGNESLYKGY